MQPAVNPGQTADQDAGASPEREISGEVTIGAPDGLATYWIAPRVEAYQLAHPKLRINLYVSDKGFNVLEREADAAVQFEADKHMDAVSMKLGTLHYCFFASHGYLERYGDLSDHLESVRHRVISHTSYVNQLENWAPRSSSLNSLLLHSLKTNSSSVLHLAAATGAGIGIMPSYASAIDRRLVALEVPPLASIRFWLVYDAMDRSIPRVRRSIEWMQEVFAPEINPWFREEFVHPKEFTMSDVPGRLV